MAPCGVAVLNPFINGRGEPLRVDDCEDRLEHREIDGDKEAYIVCEGIVVEASPYEPPATV